MSLYGALAYNYDKVAAGTAEILSGSRMISDRLGLPSEDIRLALLSFENYLLANRNTEKPVLHISLSPGAGLDFKPGFVKALIRDCADLEIICHRDVLYK